jgi:hypothetical protein
MMGPSAVSRISSSRVPANRTRRRSRRMVMADAGRPEASNRSLLAACRLVPPQAIQAFLPIRTAGIPGVMNPTAWYDGER